MEKFTLTREMVKEARDYVAIPAKQEFVSVAAPMCIERVDLFEDDGQPLPPIFAADSVRIERCLMAALMLLYLRQTDWVNEADSSDGFAVSEEMCDELLGSHVIGQFHRLKAESSIRDKCFDLLEDYHRLESMLHSEIETLLKTQNDNVARTALMNRAAARELPEAIEQMKKFADIVDKARGGSHSDNKGGGAS